MILTKNQKRILNQFHLHKMVNETRQPQRDDCEIEVKRTRTGKKIRISGKCDPSRIEILKNQLLDKMPSGE